MKPALLTTNKRIQLAIAVTSAVALTLPNSAYAAAGANQVCATSSTCEIGEFLYDDEYSPITSATCTITIKNPDDSAFVTDAAMTGQSDGWYSYDVSTTSTEGLYRTEVCCTAGSDYLCIDKTFEVSSSTGGTSTVTVDSDEIAEAVWGYSNRTLSSFGTLVRDIWLNSTRSLTTLSIDGSSSTTTASSTSTTNSSTSITNVTNTSIAGGGDLSGIEKTVKENRLLLEELVNKPIIETFIEDDELDLGMKLDETRTVTNALFANTQYLRSKSSQIVSKWNSFSDLELRSNIADLVNVVGKQGDAKNNNTILGASGWLSKSWNWDSAKTINSEVEKIAKSLDSVAIDIETRGRSTYSYNDIKSLSDKLDTIEVQIGDSTASSPDQTLFGKLREVTLIAKSLDEKNSRLGDVLAAWDSTSEGDIREELNEISQSVSTLNRVAQLRGFIAPLDSTTQGKELKNAAFAIGGVIETNRKVLANSSDHAIAATWLELGSIVFKSVIINPSSLISQKAELKYYLPPEVKEEDVKNIDNGLSVTYDVERDQYFVEGEFELDPNETITVSISLEDIWIISEEELATIARQVEELVKPLEGTAYFAQGVTLKSDIDVALDKISQLQARAVTPEQKIRAYREAMVEMHRVGELMDTLKTIVTDVSAQSTLFAYVGGAQTFGVWGIILAILAAVVFLTVYMRKLHSADESVSKKSKKSTKQGKDDKGRGDTHTPFSPPFVFGQTGWRSVAQSAIGLIVFGSIVSATTALVVVKATGADTNTENVIAEESVDTDKNVLSANSDMPVDSGFMESESDHKSSDQEAVSVGGEDIVRVEVPENSGLNIRSEATTSSEILSTLRFSTDATKIEEDKDFILVAIRMGEEGDDTIEGWVHKDFVIEKQTSHNRGEEDAENVDKSSLSLRNKSYNTTKPESDQTISSNLEIEILDTPTGWLRVRSAPRGSEIAKVNVGETFAYVDETTSWYQITLADGTNGWISKQYASVK